MHPTAHQWTSDLNTPDLPPHTPCFPNLRMFPANSGPTLSAPQVPAWTPGPGVDLSVLRRRGAGTPDRSGLPADIWFYRWLPALLRLFWSPGGINRSGPRRVPADQAQAVRHAGGAPWGVTPDGATDGLLSESGPAWVESPFGYCGSAPPQGKPAPDLPQHFTDPSPSAGSVSAQD